MKLLASILSDAEILAKSPSFHENGRTHCHAYKKFLKDLLNIHYGHHQDQGNYISVGKGKRAFIVRACNFREKGGELLGFEAEKGEKIVVSGDLSGILIPAIFVNLLPVISGHLEKGQMQIVFLISDFWGKENIRDFSPVGGRHYLEVFPGLKASMKSFQVRIKKLDEIRNLASSEVLIGWTREEVWGFVVGAMTYSGKELQKSNLLFPESAEAKDRDLIALPSLFECHDENFSDLFKRKGASLGKLELKAFKKYGDFAQSITISKLEELLESLPDVLKEKL